MASGLKKAETNEHEPKLFKVAGGVRPVMTEVSSVDITCTFFMSDGVERVRYKIPGKTCEVQQFEQGFDVLVVDEPRGRVCVGLWEEDLCLERI